MNIKKTVYYDWSIQELEKIKSLKIRPTILIHGCCAPCSSFPLEFLSPYMDITIYHNNSNVYPIQEYEIRRDELIRYVEMFNEKYQTNVKLIIPPYDEENYHKFLEPMKDLREGGKRCHMCYRIRMNEAYAYANEHHFDYFCTVMTISRQKPSKLLNSIGEELSKKYPNTKYFYSDFKKHHGILRRNEIQKEYNLYEQRHCGCRYSLKNK